jgi:hypothetical protein
MDLSPRLIEVGTESSSKEDIVLEHKGIGLLARGDSSPNTDMRERNGDFGPTHPNRSIKF